MFLRLDEGYNEAQPFFSLSIFLYTEIVVCMIGRSRSRGGNIRLANARRDLCYLLNQSFEYVLRSGLL